MTRHDGLSEEEFQEVLRDFLVESREQIDEIEANLIELENNDSSESSENINSVFRMFHSLKGCAGYLHFERVQKITHIAENLLEIFRDGRAEIDSSHIELLCQTCDFLRRLLNNIETETTDEVFEDEAEQIKTRLQEAMVELGAEVFMGSEEEALAQMQAAVDAILAEKGEGEPPAPTPPPSAQPEQPSAPKEPKEQKTTEADSMNLLITPEMVKHYVEESDDLLAEAEQALLKLEDDLENKELLNVPFRSLHSFKGNSGFFGYAALEKLSHRTENLLDGMRQGSIACSSRVIELLLKAVDHLRSGVADVSEGNEGNIKNYDEILQMVEEALEAETKKADKPKLLGEILVEDGKITEEDVDDALDMQNAPLGDILVKQGKVEAETVKAALDEQEKKKAAKPAGDQKSVQHQTVRVDTDKLDAMLDLVGEMVVAEVMVTKNPDLQGLELQRFEKAAAQLNKITREMQEIAMSIRMIPVAATFRKMLRLVRDLSRKVGKKVELELSGEDTEVDKTVIEQISDPLVHIIRNSVDHGIQSPAERKAAGKPETGHIVLEAKHAGGEIWISISDDGRGLSRPKILAKGIERGLVKGDGSTLEDEEVWALVFEPGFSTAEQVTDVSGRGVGMDVVRQNVTKLGGRIDVVSKEGMGTKVTLRIPLTLAIIDGMIISVGDAHYTVPLMDIHEFMQPKESDIRKSVDGQEIVKIRGELLPVVRLHELYDIKSKYTTLTEGILMVVGDGADRICLFMDEIIGQQQVVIKPLADYVGSVGGEKLAGISGCAVLADGGISLILDIDSLIKTTGAGKEPKAKAKEPKAKAKEAESKEDK